MIMILHHHDDVDHFNNDVDDGDDVEDHDHVDHDVDYDEDVDDDDDDVAGLEVLDEQHRGAGGHRPSIS